MPGQNEGFPSSSQSPKPHVPTEQGKGRLPTQKAVHGGRKPRQKGHPQANRSKEQDRTAGTWFCSGVVILPRLLIKGRANHISSSLFGGRKRVKRRRFCPMSQGRNYRKERRGASTTLTPKHDTVYLGGCLGLETEVLGERKAKV